MSDAIGRDRDDDGLSRMREWFAAAEDATVDGRAEAERARDYRDGKQWTADERSVLATRKQPVITDNRIRPKINFMLGMERRGRTDPRAFPRNPDDQAAAEAATDAIRYVCDATNFERSASSVLDNMLVEGFGGVDVYAEDDGGGGVDIRIDWIQWDRLFYDPFSRRTDFSDARYLGVVIWMDRDAALARWPDAGDVFEATYAYGATSQTYDDKPTMWVDRDRKRVRVVQMHYLEGEEWWLATFTGGGYVEKPAKSPYRDERGRSKCSLVLRACYVDRDGVRYGVVRDMFDLQDEVNKRRSKALHLMSVNRVIADEGAVSDEDEAREEAARPDAWIKKAPGMELQIIPNLDLAQAHVSMLAEAKASLEAAGPNAFLQGKQDKAASGRAIMASQQGGAIELDGAAMEQFHQFKKDVYEAVWARIRQFWTAEKWVRVTDEEKNVRFVGLNRPVTLAEQIVKMSDRVRLGAIDRMGLGPDDPRLAMPAMGPDGAPVIANSVAEMEVDIIIDEAPDMVALQGEQFSMIAELAARVPGFPLDVLIEASSIRNKDKILKRLRGEGQPGQAPQGPPPQAIQAQANAMIKDREAQAKIARDNAAFAADERRKAIEFQNSQAREADAAAFEMNKRALEAFRGTVQ